jgi:hypothetical protein
MSNASDWDPLPAETLDLDPWNGGRPATAAPAGWQPQDLWVVRKAGSAARPEAETEATLQPEVSAMRWRPSRYEDLMSDAVPRRRSGPEAARHAVMLLPSSHREPVAAEATQPTRLQAWMQRAWMIPVACALFAAAGLVGLPFLGADRFLPLVLAGLGVGMVWTILPREPMWFALTALGGYAAVMHAMCFG